MQAILGPESQADNWIERITSAQRRARTRTRMLLQEIFAKARQG